MTAAVLTELNVFPLKSGGGTSMESAEVTSTGLSHDRVFMLVDPNGRQLTQRELPRMALLRPAFDGRTLTVTPTPADLTSATHRTATHRAATHRAAIGADAAVDGVTARGGSHPPVLRHEATAEGPVRQVRVHRTACQGIDQGDAAAAWFSAVLDTDCRLVWFTGTRRTGRGGGVVSFADGYPLLLISAESLTDLNARLEGTAADGPLPMDRFRPNLVVEGLGPYGEDTVRTLGIGSEVVIELVKACARCVITTTDQLTATRGPEPLRTLATYRNIDHGLLFGQNAVPRSLGTVRVGDPVEVLERVRNTGSGSRAGA